jgi:CDP-glucose 4,6-dehydratase
MSFQNYFKGKRVLITGNTGFKGSWLTLFLNHLGATVFGLSRVPETEGETYIYDACQLANSITQFTSDIRDYKAILKAIEVSQPDVIFHMAAQAITITAYDHPLSTFTTNGMGTANVLEAVRTLDKKCNVIVVTSDKSYRNNEWIWGYRENDVLAGKDPYSASKSVADLIANSYYHSYFKNSEHIKIAVCRAGNVMGGGDWSKYRIVPDCIKAWMNQESIIIRSPEAIRPWNYVLDVLTGYMKTAYLLEKDNLNGESFNFGPASKSEIPVLELVETLWQFWEEKSFEPYIISRDSATYFEHRYLKLNSEKAHYMLQWRAVQDVHLGLKETLLWYKNHLENPTQTLAYSKDRIERYLKSLS